MKLATFRHAGAIRIGIIVEDAVVDLPAAVPELPREMSAFLAAGPDALSAGEIGEFRPERAARTLRAPPSVITLERQHPGNHRDQGAAR